MAFIDSRETISISKIYLHPQGAARWARSNPSQTRRVRSNSLIESLAWDQVCLVPCWWEVFGLPQHPFFMRVKNVAFQQYKKWSKINVTSSKKCSTQDLIDWEVWPVASYLRNCFGMLESAKKNLFGLISRSSWVILPDQIWLNSLASGMLSIELCVFSGCAHVGSHQIYLNGRCCVRHISNQQ